MGYCVSLPPKRRDYDHYPRNAIATGEPSAQNSQELDALFTGCLAKSLANVMQ